MYLYRKSLKKLNVYIYSKGASLPVKSILLARNIFIARNIFRTEQIFAVIMAASNVTLNFN